MNNSGRKSFDQSQNSGTINNADTMNIYYNDVPPSSPLYKFRSLIAEKTEGFVGRKYVFDAIQKFLEENVKGYFTIIGDPGMGKSAILAKYVQDTGCIAHFNEQLKGLNNANQFLESVCKQLIDRYHLPYDSLPSYATQNGNFLGQLLDEVSQKRNGKRVIIAVDALDEVNPASYDQYANILYLPPHLPDGFYFIMTRRDVDVPFMTFAPMQVFNLLDYQVQSQHDVCVRIQNRVDGSEKLRQQISERQETIPEFTKKIANKSENNFMYLRYVLLDIENGLYKDLSLESFPQGLQGYYDFHWRRMGMNVEPLPRTKINIVYILGEIRSPASCKLICKFAKEEEPTVQKVLDEWQQFLHKQSIDDKSPCYSIYHASFQDFLHRKDIVQNAKVNIGEINGMIANPLLATWNKLLRKSN
jgi:serine/threonine-protein kinase